MIYYNGQPLKASVQVHISGSGGSGASGDVVGTLDENNNILLTGELPDGTYTVRYKNADGTYTDIGSIIVGEIPEEDNTTAIVGEAVAGIAIVGE